MEALRHYAGLEDARVQLLQHEDNAVYRVDSRAGQRFVLRVSASHDGRSAAEQRSELTWLRALRAETDLAVPEPVANLDGDLVTGCGEGVTAVLLRWLPGEPPDPGISAKVVAKIGATAARLHLHGQSYVPPADFSRPTWGWDAHFAGASGPLAEVGERVRQELADAPRTLIHNDLHRDNLLVHEGGVALIDFDDCGFGDPLLDVASFLDSMRRRLLTSDVEYAPLRAAFLDGYARVRDLPDRLDARLRAAKAMRDVAVLHFILASENPEVRVWGPARLEQLYADLEAYVRADDGLR